MRPVLEHALLHVHLGDRMLDHVIDADDAAQLALIDHGDVQDVPFGHVFHHMAQAVVQAAGLDGVGHDRADRRVEDFRRGEMPDAAFPLGQRIDDVADGDDSGYALAILADHHAAGVMKLHQVGGLGDGVVGAHLDDGMALQFQKRADLHGCSPFPLAA